MAGGHKKHGEKPWWVRHSMANAGSSLFSNRSSLEGMVGMSSFSPPVAEPPVRAPERPARKPVYEPEPDPEPEYQQQPEPSGDGYVPPSEPPVRKGGLSWWQKAVIYAVAPVAVVAFLGYNALKPQQTVPVSTPTPVATATATPRATYTPQPTPTITPLPTPTATPVVSQYRQQALEQIALIGQKEPGLADVLASQDFVNIENHIRSYGLEKLRLINQSIVEGNYTLDTFVNDGNTTAIFAMSKDKFRRDALLQVVESSIPVIADFLGVEYDMPLLLIDFDASTSAGGGGVMLISANDWTLRNKTHETGHAVYERGASLPLWLQEGVAEFAGIYAASKLPQVLPSLEFLMASPEWKGRDKTVPNFEMWSKKVLNIIDTMNSRGETVAAPMTKGYVFLYEFLQLVGQDSFSKAMGGLQAMRRFMGATDMNAKLTDTDIESVLEQYVPAEKVPQFNQLYQGMVYGLRDTSQK